MAENLKTFGELFSETWQLYKRRWLTLLGVMIVSSLVVIGIMVLVGAAFAVIGGGLQALAQRMESGQVGGTAAALIAVLFLPMMILVIWSQSALVAASVDEDLGVLASLKEGWRRLWSMAWIMGLAAGVIMTGTLLIVPGIVLAVSLMFSLYPLYEDDVRGMDALMLSRRYVRGRWWNTLGKMLLIWLIMVVVQLIPFVGAFLYLLFMPFLMLFLVNMYRNLKNSAVTDEVGGRGLMWLMAWLGMIIPVLGLVGATVSLVPQIREAMETGTGLQQFMEEGKNPAVQTEDRSQTPDVSPGETEDSEDGVEREQADGEDKGEDVNLWRDPVGDTARYGVGRWLDLREVQVDSGHGTLRVVLRTAVPLQAAFNAASTTSQPLHRLAVLFFDTDVERKTGGRAGGGEVRQGYEYGLDLTLEAPRNKPRQGSIHAALFRVENGSRRFLGSLGEDTVEVRGASLLVRIPYARLGVQAGGRIRMSYQESAQKEGSGLSKDKLVELR